jgi:ACT domain-containing protein
MSDLTALATIKNNILAQLQDISANPKPNYSIDGQQVSWQSHFDSLMNALNQINAQINAAEPYEIVSRGTS